MMASSRGPVEPEIESDMKDIARAISRGLEGSGYGFLLLTFRFGEEGRMNYMSNAKRQDMIKALEEFSTNLKKDQ